MFPTTIGQISNNNLWSIRCCESDKMQVHFLPLSQQEVVSGVLVKMDEGGIQLSLSWTLIKNTEVETFGNHTSAYSED